MNDKILMTSGFNFEGYSITEYLGVFSGESALGTSFLSSLGAGFADFFGANSTMYSEKLKKAKNHAINQLIDQVKKCQGNAIIGLDIDYTIFSSDIIGVIANGTAVKVSPTNSILSESTFPIKSTNQDSPFRSAFLLTKMVQNKNFVSLDLYLQSPCNLSGILADVVFTSIFDDIYTLSKLDFTNFASKANNHLISSYTPCEIPENIFRSIKSVDVIVKKYINENKVITVSNQKLESYSTEPSNNESKMNNFSNDALILSAESLYTAKEIYEFVKHYAEEHLNTINPVLLEQLEQKAHLERLYGNSKNEAIATLKNFLQ